MHILPVMGTETFSIENTSESILAMMAHAEVDLPDAKPYLLPDGKTAPFLFYFLTELVHHIKKTLFSVNYYVQLPSERMTDEDFRKKTQEKVSLDIKKIDSVLNSLLNYINITTPIVKTDTIYVIFEEILEANDKLIRGKRLRVFNRCEKNLPETFMHNEQVRFVLNSLFQYAAHSAPLDGHIGVLIKYFDSQNGNGGNGGNGRNGGNGGNGHKENTAHQGGYIGIAMGFSDSKKSSEPPVVGDLSPLGDEPVNLILELAKEIIQKNRGTVQFDTDEKKGKTLITVRLQTERRKAVYYEPIKI